MPVEREQIGACTLYRGDCAELLPMLEADAVVTDPPYGLGKRLAGGGWGKKYSRDTEWDAHAPLLDIYMQKPSIVWGGNYRLFPPSRCWLIWYKRDALRTMADCELAWTNLDRNARVFDWTIAATNGERCAHPTQKPVALMAWCLGLLPTSSSILDPYMGSGSTGIAALRDGRAFIGIELEPRYFDIACQRITTAYAQPDLFVPIPTPSIQQPLFAHGGV